MGALFSILYAFSIGSVVQNSLTTPLTCHDVDCVSSQLSFQRYPNLTFVPDGVISMQAYIYFQNYESDSRLIKSIVRLAVSSPCIVSDISSFRRLPSYGALLVTFGAEFMSLTLHIRSTETIHSGFSISFVHHYFISNFTRLAELAKIEWCALRPLVF
jgi:hypothetical protein